MLPDPGLDHMTESTKHLNRKLSLMQNMLGWPDSKNVNNFMPERSGAKTKKDGEQTCWCYDLPWSSILSALAGPVGMTTLSSCPVIAS